MMNKKILNKICKLLQNNIIFCFLVVILFFLIIIFVNNQMFNSAIITIFVFWIFSIFYCLTNLKKNFLLIIMLLCYFTFIISRPLISFFRGSKWWYFPNNAVSKALITIYLSLCFIMIGEHIYRYFAERKKKNKEKKVNLSNALTSKTYFICFILVIISGIVNFYVEIYNYIILHNLDYALVYTNIVPTHHLIIRVISSLYLYISIFYLATMPNKKKTLFVLTLLVLTSVPSFLLGSRNMLVLRLLLSVVYIFIRDSLHDVNKKWVTKKLRNAVLALIPVFVIFMGAYNYIRDNKEVSFSSIFDLSVDTFYKQGTTFDTICQGFQYESKLRMTKQISYSFGDIIDYSSHNFIAQKLFKARAFPNGNSLIIVREGNSLAHKLSYYVLGQIEYLNGHGRGTSYILETYMDASYLWLCIYSLIIGTYLSMIVDIIKKNKIFVSYFVLTSLYEIFLLPRYSASGFISFAFKPYFWFIIMFVYFGNKVLLKYESKLGFLKKL